MTHIHLATALAVRDTGDRAAVLMVASHYANHPEALWGLPGGRQRDGELLVDTLEREVFEETGLRARARELAYVSESYDGNVHFVNATFRVEVVEDAVSSGRSREVRAGDHVVEVAWVPLSQVASRVVVGVVREPLLACLRGELAIRYAGFNDAGVTIVWPADSK